MNSLNVGIASYDEMKSWTMAVASGKIKPRSYAPKIWFTSLKAAANQKGEIINGNERMSWGDAEMQFRCSTQ